MDELRAVMSDIGGKKKYLHLYWYHLKYYIHSLHAAYRLLYRILYIYGDNQICNKHNNHNMIYGPRPVAENIRLFTSLIDFIIQQLAFIESILRFKLNVKMHDQITRLLHRLVKFFDKILWVEDNMSDVFKNGLPVKYKFLM